MVSLTTCDNNPDVDLTTEPCQNLRVSDKAVYALNKKGQAISILEGWMEQRLIRQLKQKISLLERANALLIERRTALIPSLMEGASEPKIRWKKIKKNKKKSNM
jgi:hypothetical protein